jgi:hypothetical protein
MERLTKRVDSGDYMIASENISCNAAGCSGRAADKLGRFEDFYDAVKADMENIPKELDQMRVSGKEKSYRYKELMGKKLTAGTILNLLKDYQL